MSGRVCPGPPRRSWCRRAALGAVATPGARYRSRCGCRCAPGSGRTALVVLSTAVSVAVPSAAIAAAVAVPPHAERAAVLSGATTPPPPRGRAAVDRRTARGVPLAETAQAGLEAADTETFTTGRGHRTGSSWGRWPVQPQHRAVLGPRIGKGVAGSQFRQVRPRGQLCDRLVERHLAGRHCPAQLRGVVPAGAVPPSSPGRRPSVRLGRPAGPRGRAAAAGVCPVHRLAPGDVPARR